MAAQPTAMSITSHCFISADLLKVHLIASSRSLMLNSIGSSTDVWVTLHLTTKRFWGA